MSCVQVYKATRGGVATVAVKVMGETQAGQRQANKLMEQQELFQREIHLLKSCRDKNIVQFLGACMQVWTSGLCWFSMGCGLQAVLCI